MEMVAPSNLTIVIKGYLVGYHKHENAPCIQLGCAHNIALDDRGINQSKVDFAKCEDALDITDSIGPNEVQLVEVEQSN